MRRIGLLLLGIAAGQLFAAESTEDFYTQVERTVVRLERKIPSGEFCPVGTGFFVTNQDDETFIVTARHVAVVGDLRARVPALLVEGKKTEVVELRLPGSKWVLHKNAGDEKTIPTDVAVMKLAEIQGRGITAFHYCTTNCGPGLYNQLAQDPVPPEQVQIFGFPEDLGFTMKEQRPLGRFGMVALATDEPILTIVNDPRLPEKVLAKGIYVVDARVFGGNSGGPVIVSNPFQKLRLGGLVTGRGNLDYAIVTPVSQIIETLEEAKTATPLKEAWFSLTDASVSGPMLKDERLAWAKRCGLMQ